MSKEKELDLNDELSIKQFVNDRIRFGMQKNKIIELISSKIQHTMDRDKIIDLVVLTIEDHPNYLDIQKLMHCKFVVDIENPDTIIPVDKRDHSVLKYNAKTIRQMFHKNMTFDDRTYYCKFEYDPYLKEVITQQDVKVFNTYQPPFWLKDHFYYNTPLPVCKLPHIYELYFNHLMDGKEESINYVLDWLSNSLKSRNYCFLTCIGQQGIGKGLLGDIMCQLHGESNFYKGKDQMFKAQFNSQIGDRKLVFCDELKITSHQEEDRLKDMANDRVEIEGKGKDAKGIRNHSSLYIASNRLDAIPLSYDDRRFSIVELTKEKIYNKTLKTYKIEDLLTDSNIDQLGRYLWHRTVDKDKMKVVFKTEHTNVVRSAALKDWESWFIFEFCIDHAGKEFALSTEEQDKGSLKALMKARFGLGFNPPGRAKLMRLETIYPTKFHLAHKKFKGKKQYILEISKDQDLE